MLKKFIQPAAPKGASDATAVPAAEPAPQPAAAAPQIPPPAAPAPAEEGNKLIVGPNIKLKGSEITDCEILVVEGRVEAAMNSRDIRIAQGGVFAGKAEIDVAEIRGNFEGELTARKRLVVYATGKVTGQIRYGALMIEEGGTLAGEVAALPKEVPPPAARETPPREKPETPDASPRVERTFPSPVLGRSPLGSRRA